MSDTPPDPIAFARANLITEITAHLRYNRELTNGGLYCSKVEVLTKMLQAAERIK